MNNKLLIAIVALTLTAGVGLTALHSVKVFADDNGEFPPMMQRLIQRFGLDENEVQSFVEEERELRHQERHEDLEGRLNEAVSEGKITEDQKNALIQKMEEHQEEMEDISWEERHDQMREHMDEMHEWAEENGIDIFELNLGRKGSFKGGFGAGRHGL